MKSLLTLFTVGIALVACGSPGHMEDGREATATELRFVEKGAVEFRTDADRRDVFESARREVDASGRVLTSLPSSGRVEGVVDACRVVVSLLPVDARVFRVLVEVQPMAGDRDARDVAADVAQGIANRLRP